MELFKKKKKVHKISHLQLATSALERLCLISALGEESSEQQVNEVVTMFCWWLQGVAPAFLTTTLNDNNSEREKEKQFQ